MCLIEKRTKENSLTMFNPLDELRILPYPDDGGLGEPKKNWEDTFRLSQALIQGMKDGKLGEPYKGFLEDIDGSDLK